MAALHAFAVCAMACVDCGFVRCGVRVVRSAESATFSEGLRYVQLQGRRL